MQLVQNINFPLLPTTSSFAIYRGDLEHPSAPGNKWHKLQHHLTEAKRLNVSTIATFGGPYSNHLHAMANTLRESRCRSVGVVRGELYPRLSPTLHDASEAGMTLWPSSRQDYRLGLESDVAKSINRFYGESVYWVPEGGGGVLGALGCRDWASHIHSRYPNYDAWVVSSGTGTTAAGLLAFEKTPNLHVFSALKGAVDQHNEIVEQAHKVIDATFSENLSKRLFFYSDCHEGGYAKHSPELLSFMRDFAECNPNLILDPVYTNKSMLALYRLVKEGLWPYRRTLFIHTGGLQGWRGYDKSINPFHFTV